MSIYAELHDGRKLEFPDGTDPSIVQSTVKKVLGMSAKLPEQNNVIPKSQAVADNAEQIAGNPLTRFALGAASPVIALAQGKAQLEKYIAGKMGTVNPQAEATLQQIDQLDAMKNKGMAAAEGVPEGQQGWDIAGGIGATLNPAGLAFGKALPVLSAGAKTLTRIKQGAQIGAFYGATAPVSGDGNYAGKKLEQVVGSTAAGAVLPAGWAALKFGGRNLGDIANLYLESGPSKAVTSYLREHLGADAPKLIQALDRARELVPGSKPTAAEATAHLPEGSTVSAIQKIVAEQPGNSPAFGQRIMDQVGARTSAINTIAADKTAIETLSNQRDVVTSLMRKNAIDNANIAGVKAPQLIDKLSQKQASKASALQDWGRFSTESAKAATRSNRYYPIPGVARIPARYSPHIKLIGEGKAAAVETSAIASQRQKEAEFIKYTLDSLSRHGNFPLESRALIGKIDAISKEPGLRASNAVSETMSELRNKIVSLTNDNGVINAHDLYTIRKEIGQSINANASAKGWDRRLTAKLEDQIKGYVDNSIESAGGAGWKQYLAEYANRSRTIDQMKVGQFLKDKLVSPLATEGDQVFTQRAASYAQALRDAPGTIKRSTGFNRYNELSDVLTPAQVDTANSIAADLARKAASVNPAQKTSLQNSVNIGEGATAKLPNLLYRPAMVTNWVLKLSSGRKSGFEHKIDELMKNQFLSPSELSAVLKKLSPIQRQVTTQKYMEALKTPAIGAVSTMQNRLAQ